MIHPLKIYAIKSIADANIEIEYSKIPKDIHNLVNEFIKYFKLNDNENYINDFITNFNKKKEDLIYPCSNDGLLEVVKYLVEHGADLSKIDEEFMEELSENYKCYHIIKYLIENNVKYNFGNIAHNCIMVENLDIFKWLYMRNNPKNDNNFCGKFKLLNIAAQVGSLEIVKYLVEDCNANIFDKRLPFNKLQSTAITYAAMNGQNDIMKYLVNKIPDENLTYYDDKSNSQKTL